MTADARDKDRGNAIKRVNETLRGPVADIISHLDPELADIPREDIYDRVLDDPSLLTRCFGQFRSQRHWFRHVVVDDRSRPVLDDSVVLSCGRTMEEVIAMIVRSAAKRYFRRALAEPTPDLSELSTVKADALYEAIKDFLMHEWQVALVPAYSEMTPAQVRILGAKLLIIRETEDLWRIVDELEKAQRAESVPVDETAPTNAASSSNLEVLAVYLTLDGRHLRPQSFDDILVVPAIRDMLPPAHATNPTESMHDLLWNVGGPVARIMCSGLKIGPEQLTVMLAAGEAAMGHQVFNRLFGYPGQPDLVLRLVRQGLVEGIGPASSLKDCADFIVSFVARAARVRTSGEPQV